MNKKFRAWHKVHGMSFPNETFGAFSGMENFHGSPAKDYLEDNFILMQSTGLKDKAGVEIWEGDIVLGYVVKWSESMGMWDLPRCEDESLRSDYEIQGNIYDNPDLLSPALKEER